MAVGYYIFLSFDLGPALMIAGTDDFLAPPSASVGTYSKLSTPPKLLNVIKGGWHCGFM